MGQIQRSAIKIVSWSGFDLIMGVVIVISSICIGIAIETEHQGDEDSMINYLEYVFLAIYSLELILRLLAGCLQSLADPWVLFDGSLLTVGIIGLFLKGDIAVVMVFRVLRLLRLVYAIRLVKQFETLWRITRGLLTCWNSIFSAMALVITTLYMFACLGVEIIHDDDWPDEVKGIVEEYFRSVPIAMLTLSQFVAEDSIASIYKPLVEERPALVMYFVPLIVILSITLMNLVTGVIVENFFEKTAEDNDLKHRDLRLKVQQAKPAALQLFKMLDIDNSGVITLKEIKKSLKQGMELPGELKELVIADDLVELFETLDDGDGELGELEFIDGVLKAMIADVPQEWSQMLKLLRTILRKLRAHDSLPSMPIAGHWTGEAIAVPTLMQKEMSEALITGTV